MKPSSIQYLLRPWKPYKDGTLFYGISKSGSNRHPLTTKQGNKNFYKGTRSSGIGRHTTTGRYVINWEKVRTYVVPTSLRDSELKPFVCQTAPLLKHTFSGYPQGPTDGKLYLDKIEEYIEYGENEAPEAIRSEKLVERG